MEEYTMTPLDVLASPIIIIIFALATGYLVYAWSRTFAPPFTWSANKAMPYVGGEAVKAQAYRPGYQFFFVALFFTVVHVAALFLVIAPSDAPLWATLGYLFIVFVAVTILRWEQ
jgi:NADH:ubiquinone oxidoreductase subunit 3 (subunit A)